MIEPVAEAEAMEAAAPLLEEGDDGLERGEAAHAVAGIPAAARMGPAGIALLAAGAEQDDVGAPLRPARGAERHVEREGHLVEGGHGLLA